MLEILLYGIVGDPDAGLDAATIVSRIQDSGGDITVRINSAGGLVFDGLAIVSALQQSGRRVVCMIDGVAASMASVIAMVGTEIVMAESALLMIHNPTDGTYGDAADLRAAADRLDMIRDQIAGIYAARTGLSAADLAAMMAAETWLTAPEALAAGFITSIAAPMRMAACDVSAFGFRKAPAHPLIALAKRTAAAAAVIDPEQETIIMPEGTEAAATTTATTASTVDTSAATTAATVAAANAAAAGTGATVANVADQVATAVASALATERARAVTIRNEVNRARLEPGFADTLIAENVTIEAARTRIIDQIATNAPTILNYLPAQIPAAQFAARAEAMTVAILHRANPRNQLNDDARAFAGRRLSGLARDWLDSTGISTRMMSDVEVARTVFRQRGPVNAGMHVISDFPALMGNTVGRTLRRAYELAPKTFPSFCRQATVPDFRPVSRVALSDISPMKQVAEAAEYQYATVGDSAEQYTVGKWGQIISLSWETIINDDLAAFDRLPTAMGLEASQIEGDVVYAILLGNPAMADGVAVFAAGHGNLAAAGTPITVMSLTAGRVAMRTQKAPQGRFLALAPAYLVVGPLQEQAALQFTSANYVATRNADINPAYNQALKPIVDPRINDLSWYLLADPNALPIDTIEYSYLAGAEGVMIEQRQGFEVDGLDIKARLVFGAKAIDYRGLYRNPGA